MRPLYNALRYVFGVKITHIFETTQIRSEGYIFPIASNIPQMQLPEKPTVLVQPRYCKSSPHGFFRFGLSARSRHSY